MQSWLPLFAAIVAPSLTALLGYAVFVQRQKAETKWQEKYKAYREILDAIDSMEHWADETHSGFHCLPTIGGDPAKTQQAYIEARRCVSKYITIGKLVISDEVADKLSDLVRDLFDEDFRFQDNPVDDAEFPEEQAKHAQHVQRIIRDYLGGIITLAKKDLR